MQVAGWAGSKSCSTGHAILTQGWSPKGKGYPAPRVGSEPLQPHRPPPANAGRPEPPPPPPARGLKLTARAFAGQSTTPRRPPTRMKNDRARCAPGGTRDQIDGPTQAHRQLGAILVQPNPATQFQSQAAPFHQPGAAIHNDRSTFTGRNLCEQGFEGEHFAQGRFDGGPGGPRVATKARASSSSIRC